jgi:nucleoside-diphosphate-sugar epimerase
MPRAAVTGSSGKLGRAVVDHLHDSGWDVVALDQAAPARDGITSTRVDLTDFGQTYEALAGIDDRHDGVDAVVHLAAIPAPGLRPNAATFHNNMTATYNVSHPAPDVLARGGERLLHGGPAILEVRPAFVVNG